MSGILDALVRGGVLEEGLLFWCGGGIRGGMKVCLDIQATLGQRAGVGRYVRELLRHLPAQRGYVDAVCGWVE